MILELLPLLEGWEDFSVDIDSPITIAPGKTYTLAEATYPGWLYALQVTTMGSDKAEFIIEKYVYGAGFKRFTIRPVDLFNLGLDMPNPSSPYISNWDSSTQTYTIVYTPAIPLQFYADVNRPIRIYIKAIDTPVVILDYSQVAYKIVDKDKFINSLQRIIGDKIVEEVRKHIRW